MMQSNGVLVLTTNGVITFFTFSALATLLLLKLFKEEFVWKRYYVLLQVCFVEFIERLWCFMFSKWFYWF